MFHEVFKLPIPRDEEKDFLPYSSNKGNEYFHGTACGGTALPCLYSTTLKA
jgi:hypothetical protein